VSKSINNEDDEAVAAPRPASQTFGDENDEDDLHEPGASPPRPESHAAFEDGNNNDGASSINFFSDDEGGNITDDVSLDTYSSGHMSFDGSTLANSSAQMSVDEGGCYVFRSLLLCANFFR